MSTYPYEMYRDLTPEEYEETLDFALADAKFDAQYEQYRIEMMREDKYEN